MSSNKITILDDSKFGNSPSSSFLPRCDAICQPETVTWRRKHEEHDDGRCKCKASMRIEGKNLCKKHGGGALLKLLGEGRLELKDKPK